MYDEMEAFLPVVAKLAERYTGFESTSVTYEKAEQLMGAVLYCIKEMENCEQNSIVSGENRSAQQAYEIGYQCVVEKVTRTLKLYHDILSDFSGYGNRCLYDTVIKRIPEFFKWYDAEFEPQNTIVLLDYPVGKDLSKYSGIDKIYEFLSCIRIEQLFLHAFPEDEIRSVLCKCDCEYQNMLGNICETVYMVVLCHVLIQKPWGTELQAEDYARLQKTFLQTDEQEIKEQLTMATRLFVQKYEGENKELSDYLLAFLEGIFVRLKMAVQNDSIKRVFCILGIEKY